jgi:hypothetical protein
VPAHCDCRKHQSASQDRYRIESHVRTTLWNRLLLLGDQRRAITNLKQQYSPDRDHMTPRSSHAASGAGDPHLPPVSKRLPLLSNVAAAQPMYTGAVWGFSPQLCSKSARMNCEGFPVISSDWARLPFCTRYWCWPLGCWLEWPPG